MKPKRSRWNTRALAVGNDIPNNRSINNIAQLYGYTLGI